MAKGTENGRAYSGSDKPKSASRFAATIGRKRKRNVSDNAFDIPNNVDAILTSDSGNDSEQSSGDVDSPVNHRNDSGESASGSGSDGDGIGARIGDGIGSDGNPDNNPAAVTGRKRRGRRSAEDRAREFSQQNSIGIEEARKIIESQKRPRKVRNYSEDLADGVVASALLLGAVFEGGSELLAMSVGKPYFKLDRAESTELGDAILKVLDTLPKSTRKKFDALIAKYYPYWNLAKVATKISYPRYLIYQMEVETRKNVQAQASAPESAGVVENQNRKNDSRIETPDSSDGSDFDFGTPNFG